MVMVVVLLLELVIVKQDGMAMSLARNMSVENMTVGLMVIVLDQ